MAAGSWLAVGDDVDADNGLALGPVLAAGFTDAAALAVVASAPAKRSRPEALAPLASFAVA